MAMLHQSNPLSTYVWPQQVASDVAAAAALPLPDGRNHLAEAPDLFVTPTTGLDSGGMLNKVGKEARMCTSTNHASLHLAW